MAMILEYHLRIKELHRKGIRFQGERSGLVVLQSRLHLAIASKCITAIVKLIAQGLFNINLTFNLLLILPTAAFYTPVSLLILYPHHHPSHMIDTTTTTLVIHHLIHVITALPGTMVTSRQTTEPLLREIPTRLFLQVWIRFDPVDAPVRKVGKWIVRYCYPKSLPSYENAEHSPLVLTTGVSSCIVSALH